MPHSCESAPQAIRPSQGARENLPDQILENLSDSSLNDNFKAFGAIFHGTFWSEDLNLTSISIELHNLTFFNHTLQSHK